MKTTLYPFMAIAGCGLVLSAVVHCIALTGATIPGGNLIWVLHAGIFVVWIPAISASRQMTQSANSIDFWKIALAGCPLWMRLGLSVFFIYAIINFAIFIIPTIGQPKQPAEIVPSPAVVRGFSGHWMFFYSAAFGILYSRINAPQIYRDRKCPQGHKVSPTATFCPECWHDFSNEMGKRRR
jgi:hypothetical protein